MCAQPGEQIGGFLKAIAVSEDGTQTACFMRHLRQQFIGVAIAIRHKTKVGRLIARQSRINSAIIQCIVRKHDKTGEMDGLECAKRHERVGRIGKAGAVRERHGYQQRSQRVDAAGLDLSDDNKTVLRAHAPISA